MSIKASTSPDKKSKVITMKKIKTTTDKKLTHTSLHDVPSSAKIFLLSINVKTIPYTATPFAKVNQRKKTIRKRFSHQGLLELRAIIVSTSFIPVLPFSLIRINFCTNLKIRVTILHYQLVNRVQNIQMSTV